MDFEDFYGRYVDRVASYVLRHTSLRDAEDIVAETFTVAWRKRIERLDDPMPWLIVTARNVTRQVRRTYEWPQVWPGKLRLAETLRWAWWGQRVVIALARV